METENLSVDSAVELLTAAPDTEIEKREAPQAADAPHETEADTQSADDTDAPETASDGDEGEGDEPETAINPPSFWDANEREVWAELTPQAQAIVAAKEQERIRFTSQKVEEAALARKAAEYQATEYAARAAYISDLLPQVQQAVANRWDGIDWLQLSQADPATYVALSAEYQAESAQLQQLQAEAANAEAFEYRRFIEAETPKLATLVPELMDPKTGAANRNAVAQYATSVGIDQHALKHASAVELTLLWKAMQHDKFRANLGKQTQSAPNIPAAVKPSGASVRSSSSGRQATQARNAFAQTRSVDDAVRALLAG